MFGELPELLIAISRSPARAKRSSGSANTSSNTSSLAVAVNSEASLKACARSRPFLQASAAKWLAIAALAPLPIRYRFCPRVWTSWVISTQRWKPSSTVSGCPACR